MKIDHKKIAREQPYYEMVLFRLCDEMNDQFYSLHKTKLDELAFLIESHKQDKDINHGNGTRT